jgi:hypothetical protein
VSRLIEEMAKHVKRGVYGFLEQMSYDMCKILGLTAAASIYDFDMQRYTKTPEGLKRVGDIARELGKNRDLGSNQTKMVSEEMQNLFAQNVRVNRLFHTRYDLDALDADQMLRLHGPMAEILNSCEAMASLRVGAGASLYQHTLEFRRYLTARFGYDAESMGLMASPEAVGIGSQGEARSPNVGVLLRQLREYM